MRFTTRVVLLLLTGMVVSLLAEFDDVPVRKSGAIINHVRHYFSGK